MIYQLKNAYFSYPKSPPLLEDISLTLEKGEVIAILGPNGAGKTTLLKCMLGILKLKQGACLFEDTPIQDYGLKLWEYIGYVPQAKNYSTSFLVEDMILLGRNVHIKPTKQPSKIDLEIVKEKMEYLGISYLYGKSCNRISGGELQMVLMARTLASNPKMLILDEPESNLDYANQLTVLNSIEKLASEGISCIFNTHYPDHALRIANKSLMIQKGKSICFGDSKDIVNPENMEKVFGVSTHVLTHEYNDKQLASILCLDKI